MHPEAMGQKADDEDAGNVEQQAHANHLAQPDLAEFGRCTEMNGHGPWLAGSSWTNRMSVT